MSEMLAGRVVVARDRFTLDVELALRDGERVGVIGANGSGKSTLLAALAGLAPLAADSTVAWGKRPWRSIPVEKRSIGFIAQDGLLFPHLNVLDNVAFGPRSAGSSKREAREIAGRMLEEVGASHLASAAATAVSGGERQRVALARALATDPSLLILDEPFAALDVDASVEVREIAASQVRDRGLSLLLVTHDLVDAVRLTDRVIVLEDGHAVEQIATRDLQRTPGSKFAASFAGLARVQGVLEADWFHTGSGTRIPLAGLELEPSIAVGDSALLLASPDRVEVTPETERGQLSDSRFEDAVESLVGDGSAMLARLRSGLLARMEPDGVLASGTRVQTIVHRGSVRAISLADPG